MLCLSLQTLLFPVLLNPWRRQENSSLLISQGSARIFPHFSSHCIRVEENCSLHRGAPNGPFTPATCFLRRQGLLGRRQRAAPSSSLGHAGPHSASTKRTARRARSRAHKGAASRPRPSAAAGPGRRLSLAHNGPAEGLAAAAESLPSTPRDPQAQSGEKVPPRFAPPGHAASDPHRWRQRGARPRAGNRTLRLGLGRSEALS